MLHILSLPCSDESCTILFSILIKPVFCYFILQSSQCHQLKNLDYPDWVEKKRTTSAGYRIFEHYAI